MEVVLKNPDRYKRLGGKIPKGVRIVGAPGTGKTLLAKAVAGEAGVPFLSLGGSEVVEMFVGVGAARVGDLFEQAAAKAPCIVSALLRPGRFDRHVAIDRPDLDGRRQFLDVHVKHVRLAASVDLAALAARTPGFAGADLAKRTAEAIDGEVRGILDEAPERVAQALTAHRPTLDALAALLLEKEVVDRPMLDRFLREPAAPARLRVAAVPVRRE